MTHSLLLLLLVTLSPLLLTSSCTLSVQSIRIAAQDFRFVPALVQVEASRPVRLVVVNEGREVHEFAATLLADPHAQIFSEPPQTAPRGEGLRLPPGKTLEILLRPQPGTYLFRCLIRGHAGMQGTLVVEG
ncbi:cupredoxin domain-containing protein [Nitrospira sp. Kam-Ns4a]